LQNPTELALRFCLSFTPIIATIPGMMSEEEVIENVSSAQAGPLDEKDISAIRKTYKTLNTVKEKTLETSGNIEFGKVNTN